MLLKSQVCCAVSIALLYSQACTFQKLDSYRTLITRSCIVFSARSILLAVVLSTNNVKRCIGAGRLYCVARVSRLLCCV